MYKKRIENIAMAELTELVFESEASISQQLKVFFLQSAHFMAKLPK